MSIYIVWVEIYDVFLFLALCCVPYFWQGGRWFTVTFSSPHHSARRQGPDPILCWPLLPGGANELQPRTADGAADVCEVRDQPQVRAPKAEELTELEAVLTRRRQLIEMITTETHRQLAGHWLAG